MLGTRMTPWLVAPAAAIATVTTGGSHIVRHIALSTHLVWHVIAGASHLSSVSLVISLVWIELWLVGAPPISS